MIPQTLSEIQSKKETKSKDNWNLCLLKSAMLERGKHGQHAVPQCDDRQQAERIGQLGALREEHVGQRQRGQLLQRSHLPGGVQPLQHTERRGEKQRRQIPAALMG